MTPRVRLPGHFDLIALQRLVKVRAAVISAAASILSGQHAHIVIQSVAPLVMSLAKESLRECSSVLISVARHFGELSFALHSFISSDERKWLIFLYQNMTRMGLSRPADTLRHSDYLVTRDSQESIKWAQQIRTEVAFSFPKVVVFFQSENCVDVLMGVFRDLSRDPHIPVRCMFSRGLYESLSAIHQCSSRMQQEDLDSVY
ncbi:serine/threonine-protein phosphatase 4 regulatory subunit 4-like [Schistocerca gregaria]|uniref:serine/threonine-protein phosphatase 4 regulatory subunit 4-like n=1 Tax=Schistocerca gregaria TaxID=7010 RepID=UPI00211E610F|nr:serine/threonine-protein phosphatase 4 regulatory subunit 4-like [Schistocerca gregaria]